LFHFKFLSVSDDDDDNLCLIMVKTNRSTLHTVYNIQQSATQGINDTTHRLPRRTATTRFSPESKGCQKQTAPRFCQHPIRWAFTSQAFTRWCHL